MATTHPKKVQQLALRAAESRNKFTRRAFTALKRFKKKQAAAAQVVAEGSVQLLRKFTVNAVTLSSVAPLVFQKPTKLFVKSEAEKKRAIV